MNNGHNIPEEDRILSQKLQQLLHSDMAEPEINDPIVEVLIDFKNQVYSADMLDLEQRKLRVWNNISNVLNQPSENVFFEFFNQNVWKLTQNRTIWKVAAVVLLTLFATLILDQYQGPATSELARTDTAIETVLLPDGSEAVLRPNSVLYSIMHDDKIQSYRLEGEAVFSVVSNPDRRFIVETELGSAEALGTRFNVRTWQNETSVYLESGSLRLRTADQQKETVLSPGELSVITTESEITGPVIVDREHYTSWQKSEIVFNNRSASSIFREIEHHFSIAIQAPEDINNTYLGGSISLSDLEISLQHLGLALEGEFILIENNRYRFHGF